MSDNAPLREQAARRILNAMFYSGVSDKDAALIKEQNTQECQRALAYADAALPTDAVQPVDGVDREAVGPVVEIEMVSYETGFEQPAPSKWRVQIGECCADFETETAANNFRNAILALYATAPQYDQAAMDAFYGAGWSKMCAEAAVWVKPEHLSRLKDSSNPTDSIHAWREPPSTGFVALYATAPTAGSGWVMVPREPTEAMRKAGQAEWLESAGADPCHDVYRAMITAAPTVGEE